MRVGEDLELDGMEYDSVGPSLILYPRLVRVEGLSSYPTINSLHSADALVHLVIPTHPFLKPHDRMLHHFRFILPLLGSDEDELTPLHYYDSAIQLARTAHREPTEHEFELGMEMAEAIKQILTECRLEMLEGSSTQLNGISEESQ
ncbi:hypothetical protein WG66_015494 [Moniliophthora roreri]|nr:hypothetical protein WG66_015494 [Moniliophthora roreri]